MIVGIAVFRLILISVGTIPVIPPDNHTPSSSARGDGDVNVDGFIDIVDALMVAQYYSGIIESLLNETAADANNDGFINDIDALNIAANYVNSSNTLRDWVPYTSRTGGPNECMIQNPPL